ncbi:hypothetical protein [Bacillus sp. SJS]|uniref:hypothetical protein n=1 Tax=Bacillus sp. SJS TaxID=1423321 RepID=UPI0004DCEC93|nr:hypothetical protein [Bacillus sp. SJS]KZZ85758.1 hypothetical protein AS29_003985 [Bacillus sp. SJS]
MKEIDKRNRLDEKPFSFQIAKNQSVFLFCNGKQVKIVKGREAEKFLARIHLAKDEREIQLILAKATGNFKRGNERMQ